MGLNISLLQYYDHCFTVFCRQYGKAKLRLSKKLIHQLRLDIKHMRAIFNLLKLTGNESCKDEKNISALDDLFRTAGEVREEQVNLSILHGYSFSSSMRLFEKYLIRRKRAALYSLHKSLNEFNQSYSKVDFEEYKSLLESTNHIEIVNPTQNFINKRIKNLRKIYPDLSNKNLHNIRKELKAIITIPFILQENFPHEIPAILLTKIKPLETRLGVWHNRIVLISSIKQFLTNDESFPEVLRLQNLLRIIKKQNKKTIRQIDKKMMKLLG